jgi:hypothetical protein
VVESGRPAVDPPACQGHRLPPPAAAGGVVPAQRHDGSNRVLIAVFCAVLLAKAGATIAIVRAMRKRARLARSPATPT